MKKRLPKCYFLDSPIRGKKFFSPLFNSKLSNGQQYSVVKMTFIIKLQIINLDYIINHQYKLRINVYLWN